MQTQQVLLGQTPMPEAQIWPQPSYSGQELTMTPPPPGPVGQLEASRAKAVLAPKPKLASTASAKATCRPCRNTLRMETSGALCNLDARERAIIIRRFIGLSNSAALVWSVPRSPTLKTC